MEKEIKSSVGLKSLPITRGVIGVLLGSLILFVLFNRVSPQALLAELAHLDKVKIIWAVAFIGLSYVCRAALWQRLMHQFHHYRYDAVFRSTMVGYLANNILPARLGDIARGGYLRLTQGGGSGFIFGSLALERVMDVSIILASIGVISFFLNLHYAWLIWSVVILGLLVVAFFIAVAVARRWMKRDLSLPSFLARIKEQVSRFVSKTLVVNLGDAMSIGNASWGIPWLVITWLVTFWGIYFTLDALGLTHQLGIPQVVLILCIGSLGLAVPSLPASLGTYQAAFVFGGIIVGIPESKALSASFLYQGLWVSVTSVFGLSSLTWDGLDFKKSLKQLWH